MQFSRFKKLAEKHGFRIKKASEWINGHWLNRPDVCSVQYQGHHIMSVPKRMYGEPQQRANTIVQRTQPSYFECEHKLKNWNYIIKRQPHIKGLEQKKLYDGRYC